MVISLNWQLTGYVFHSHQLHFKAATVIKQYNLLLAKKCWCAVTRKVKSLAVLGTGGSALYPKLLSSISHNGVNAFFSRVMNSTQRNYCTTRRELLAVISTLQHFRHYLLGNKVVLRTDQHSLYKNTSNIMFFTSQLLFQWYNRLWQSPQSANTRKAAVDLHRCQTDCTTILLPRKIPTPTMT